MLSLFIEKTDFVLNTIKVLKKADKLAAVYTNFKLKVYKISAQFFPLFC